VRWYFPCNLFPCEYAKIDASLRPLLFYFSITPSSSSLEWSDRLDDSFLGVLWYYFNPLLIELPRRRPSPRVKLPTKVARPPSPPSSLLTLLCALGGKLFPPDFTISLFSIFPPGKNPVPFSLLCFLQDTTVIFSRFTRLPLRSSHLLFPARRSPRTLSVHIFRRPIDFFLFPSS